MANIRTKLVGVTFGDCPKIIRECKDGGIRFCTLDREPNNPADPSAVSIRVNHQFHIGYLPRTLAAKIADQMDAGENFEAEIQSFNLIDENGPIGVTIEIFPSQLD